MNKTYVDRANARIQRREIIEKLKFCLMYMYPGQDVEIKFRKREHRDLSGFWTWDLTTLQHVHTPTLTLRSARKGREWSEYHKLVVHRRWSNYRAIERLEQKIKDGLLRPQADDPVSEYADE